MNAFHPAVLGWFRQRFPTPIALPTAACPATRAGDRTVVATAPALDKKPTAALAWINELTPEGIAHDEQLPDPTRMDCFSPLKTLSNDIQIQREASSERIRAGLTPVQHGSMHRTSSLPVTPAMAY